MARASWLVPAGPTSWQSTTLLGLSQTWPRTGLAAYLHACTVAVTAPLIRSYCSSFTRVKVTSRLLLWCGTCGDASTIHLAHLTATYLIWISTFTFRAMFSCPKFQNLVLCKKKIFRHIKLMVHAWSTKCWRNQKLIVQFSCTLRDEHFELN